MFYFVVGGGKTKIGVTSKPSERLQQLQTGSPVPLKMVLVVDGELSLERKVFRVLRNRHSHNEWFNGEVTLDEAREVLRLADNETSNSISAIEIPPDEVPTCDCHGEPMAWLAGSHLRLGGYWKCKVHIRDLHVARLERKGEYRPRRFCSDDQIQDSILLAVGLNPGRSWHFYRHMRDEKGQRRIIGGKIHRTEDIRDALIKDGFLVNTHSAWNEVSSIPRFNPGKRGKFVLWLPKDVPESLNRVSTRSG